MRSIFTLLLIVAYTSIQAQTETGWTLQQAVQYALDNNISIQQNALNQRLAKLTHLQSQLSQLPNINGSASYGRSFGRSVDPTTNQFVQGTSYDFMGLSGNADVLLFGWFQKRNSIASNKYNYLASGADLDQLKNDISLNVATGYLRALLAKEQVNISKQQVKLSSAQLTQTRKFAEAGRVPELDVAQLEAQLANDSANLITALTDYTASILDIKALLNLDFQSPFDVVVPQMNMASDGISLNMSPEDVYIEAAKNFGTVRSSMYKLQAAQRNFWAAKGNLMPQLGLGAQLGTNWSSTVKEVASAQIVGARETGDFVPVLDTTLAVYRPDVKVTTRDVPLKTQLDNNFRQTVSLSLNIPIFNGWQSQYAVKQAKINMLTQELNTYQAELKLKQDVYKAYNDATNSIQKYYAAERAATSAQRAFDFAQKRYDLGLTNTVEYLTTQNNMYSATGNLARAKYDLIFKLKVIDYYLGKELKL
ncbi:hypothetical protein CAP35_09965 [Chitinophagaceae bacterium IBVUCB1]|nr:hypothetical protein CAP35_09965 [Chitinophagaceae bacterium IBVUCB1]